MFWIAAEDLGRVMAVMEVHGLSNVQKVCWYKDDQNMTGNPARMISSWEVFVLGSRLSANRGHNINNLDKNPLKRHNMLTGPGLHKYNKHPDGSKVNIHQKPTYLAKWLCDNFAQPDDNVLVCGSGAGGEVYGCLEAHCNVVCMDTDAKQMEYLRGNLETYDARKANTLLQEATKARRQDAKAKKDAKEEGDDLALEDSETCDTCGVELTTESKAHECPGCQEQCCDTCAVVTEEQGEFAYHCSEPCKEMLGMNQHDANEELKEAEEAESVLISAANEAVLSAPTA
jgi:hypothetical protein